MSTADEQPADRETWESVSPNPSADELGIDPDDDRVAELEIGSEGEATIMYDRENHKAWLQSSLAIDPADAE